MDARVNDFLNEINEIAPIDNKTECEWEKCYDDDSGYYYYWNTKSNEVTWDMPPEYCKVASKMRTKKASNLYMPPRTAPLFPSTSKLLPPISDAIKIYKIGESATDAKTSVKSKGDKVENEQKPAMNDVKMERNNVSLVPSYTTEDNSSPEKSDESKKDTERPVSNSHDDENIDLSTKNPQKTKELNAKPAASVKATSGFSLIAGYSDSEDETDDKEEEKEKVVHSTLFPATKPIDVNDFKVQKVEIQSDFDDKAFQRKKRIGVALINVGKKPKIDEERKGLGFNGDAKHEKVYGNFKSGGVMFESSKSPPPETNDDKEKVTKEVENDYTTLKEKLGFLSEGREAVFPVQAMLIQLETLYTALKAGGLKRSYLQKWLDETCSDLIKLEKEATPDGWLLQWDRSHKRYYYHNQATGEGQWEYPQLDVNVCDEAMDICTTPPPSGSESTIHMSPPPPPVIGSPSPPPAPTIGKFKKKAKCDIPLPPEAKEVENDDEPLPPGVDLPESSQQKKDMNDVLSSFYSDIAKMETSNSPTPAVKSTEDNVEQAVEGGKKKKKTKVKLAQGLSMKKKGVSKLVEKWKNVQMSYD